MKVIRLFVYVAVVPVVVALITAHALQVRELGASTAT
jgi:hypothetical protein